MDDDGPLLAEGYVIVEVIHGHVVVEGEIWVRGHMRFGGAYRRGSVIAVPQKEAELLVASGVAKVLPS